jgi:hypothetical protein
VLLDEVENALGSRFHDGARYLILVESLRSHWPRAWVFYPSTDETPAHVMHPGGVGSGAAPLRWDAWQPATPRMEEIVLEATEANPPPTVAEGSDQSGADGPARARGMVIAVVVLTAVVAGLGVVRRGGWLRRWGRQRVNATNIVRPCIDRCGTVRGGWRRSSRHRRRVHESLRQSWPA